ncbi:SMI1/KNR4 family protein [Streptomyces anulatus]|uniref:SMI1/KNR4 family protein n=2 Tax=Streptomyces anulatus TaxID=1892 RepID=UPI00099670B4|nr:SMI1/KNR4 family protein [Streptomyces anulatus]
MRHHALTRLVAPPAKPIDASGDWTVPEMALGVRLPEDYKWLVETYGWGEFCDFLYLRTPFGTSKYNGVEWQSGRLPEAPDRDRERYPYPLHPSPGGLLIWATTMDADRLCWLAVGDPQDWPVVVWSRDGQYETFAMGAAEFIEGWAGGHMSSRQLGDMEPDLAPWFNAFRPRVHRCLRLGEGQLRHPDRLRVLREALGPTADRGSWWSDHGESGQDHFATVDTDWLLTYDMSCPHQIRISFPPEDTARVRQRLFDAVRLMGCEVLRITTGSGAFLPSWEAATEEECQDLDRSREPGPVRTTLADWSAQTQHRDRDDMSQP